MAGNPLASLPGLPQRPSLARSSASETRLTQPGIEGARSRKLNSAPTAAFRIKSAKLSRPEMKGVHIGGEGKVAEVDGAYFGGYVKPANHVENRRDRRLAVNQNGKRQVVVVIRERDGRSLTQVFKNELQSTTFIRTRVNKGTELMADEANSWNGLA